VEITLQKYLTKIFPPKNEVVLGLSPKICISHVPYKSDTVKNVLSIGSLFEDVVSSDPFSFHEGHNLRFLFRFQKKQKFFR
jgi:hypothetical protein